ncbi:hypothetical protein [Candidatus Odyssella acanthamoebae]|uniref:Uncharacterized protein n=1 Tax=Candidatus Odyssella acanthamoebae TaxID=91604 RepID=A0A077AZ28_9PROT|nr:hypothetical protein [Candidatus Paracaedibacter acanthamoebae]AIK95950.1 hypothetical protein ID47_03150 [Candidatus Paracaedibacter acanthamoebae]
MRLLILLLSITTGVLSMEPETGKVMELEPAGSRKQKFEQAVRDEQELPLQKRSRTERLDAKTKSKIEKKLRHLTKGSEIANYWKKISESQTALNA